MVDMPQNPIKPNLIYSIYMYKGDLALNDLQWLICHKTQPNQILYIQYICKKGIVGYLIPNLLYTYILNIYDL